MRYLFIIILLCGVGKVNAQQSKEDSLLTVYNKQSKVDTAKLHKLKTVIDAYHYRDAKKAMLYADSLVFFAKQLNIAIEIANAYIVRGMIYKTQSFTNKALDDYFAAESILKRIDNKSLLQIKSDLYYRIGQTYRSSSTFDKALENFKKSLDLAYLVNNKASILNGNTAIALLYMAIADWQTALIKFESVKAIIEANNFNLFSTAPFSKNVYAACLINLNTIYNVYKRYDDAITVSKNALEIQEKYKLSADIKFAIINTFATTYYFKKEYEKSYDYAMLSYVNNLKSNGQRELAMDNTNLGRIFRDAPDSFLIKKNVLPKLRYDTAISLFKKSISIAESLNSLTLREDPLEDLSILYEKTGNYAASYHYYKRFKAVHDSLADASQQKRILINDMQYQFGRQTDSLKFSQALVQSHLREQLSANEQKAIIANKENELQHLALLQSQTQLQNKSLENNRNEKELSLIKKEKELQAAQVGKLAKDKEFTDLKLKQQKIYAIIAIACLMVFTSLFIYNTHLRRKRMAASVAKDKAEQLLKEAELQNRMNDITLSALRSQMNPHFIFNCLNSIKLYTKENNTTEASDYIGKFAKLIRNMLDNSRSDRISLQSEIESLKLYIELEAMRFKDKLQYAINVDKDLDTSFIDIPPLLVQPYIENAIWHGLMPKKEGGHININILQNTSDNLLIIEVVDNGIGRTASAAINSKKQNYHKSLGTTVTGERIALINEKYQSKANVTITDLYNNNQPAGTQVTIKLPME